MKSIARGLAVLSLVAGVHAADAGPVLAPSLSRAEVLADLHVYQEAGVYLMDASEISPLSSEYRAARLRYEALRASPRYAELVEQYGAHRIERTAIVVR